MTEFVSAHRRKKIEERSSAPRQATKKAEPQRRSAVSKRAAELVGEGLTLADASARAEWEVAIAKTREPTLSAWASDQLAALARERAFEKGESPAEASRIVASRNKALIALAYSSPYGNLPLSKARAELVKMTDGLVRNADELTRTEDVQDVVAMLKAIQ